MSVLRGEAQTELIRRHGPWTGLDAVEPAMLEYLDWYNHRRLHTACDHRPPAEFEAIYYRHDHNLVTTAETQ